MQNSIVPEDNEATLGIFIGGIWDGILEAPLRDRKSNGLSNLLGLGIRRF